MIRKSKLKDLPQPIREEIERYAKKRNSSISSDSGEQHSLEYNLLQNPESSDEEYRISEQVAALLAKLNESELRPIGHQFDTMILSCKYQGVHCTNLTKKSFWSSFWHYKYGNCFTFNPKVINGEEQKGLTTAKTGPSDGLVLEIDVEQYEYIDQLTQDAGAIIHISPRGNMPFPFEEGIHLSPGFSTYLGMRLVQIKKVDRFGNTSCVSIDTKNTIYADKYNTSYSKMVR
ncbi:Amiloride-sensitive sodium channel subunit beta [Exaiptasia diaphana]|nr:Amiloride-sensitive sodium channel subunit beta [Exaiptasia diaphana]